MKIVYLHGLESNNLSPKNHWLKSISNDLYDPNINYKEDLIYKKLKSKINAFSPNIIIGSSMGGYFAYEIAKELNINAILFNPALHSRSYEPDMTGLIDGNFNPFMYFILGENDKIINPFKTIEIIKQKGNNKYTLLNHEHDTSIELFKKEINFFIETNKLD